MTKYPIFVISKGRPKTCLTCRELNKMGVSYSLVVEPQEYDLYSGSAKNIIKTPFSNLGQGSIPVRNFVWDLAKKRGFEKHWVLDDNIEGFHRLHQNEKYKIIKGDACFRACEDFTDQFSNIGLSGMNYYNFCKKTDPVAPFNFNTRIYSCILVNHEIPFFWRGRFNEDTDLSLRVLEKGFCTVLFNAFLIGKVTTQRMKGGNTNDLYEKTNDRLEFAKSLENQHPEKVKTVWKFNRWHHQVNYSSFKQRLERVSFNEKKYNFVLTNATITQ